MEEGQERDSSSDEERVIIEDEDMEDSPTSPTIRILIDDPFSRVLVIIQLLMRQPSYQPTIDNESWIINS
jgi:hypothetical protein